MRTRSRRLVLAVACFGLFFVQLDVTVVNVALRPIGSGLGAGTATLQWVVDAYGLALSSLILGAGDLADLAGRRRVFVSGLALFGASSVVCALAQSAGVLVAGRAVQGIGAAALLPTSLAIVNHAYTEPRERAQAIGIWAGVSALALVSGPVAGGALVSGLGWRSIFWLNAPLCALAVVIALRVVPESADPSGRRLDLPGQLGAVVFLGALVFGLIESEPLALIVAAGVLVAFLIREQRAPDPMLELSWFRRRSFSAANAASGLMNLGTLGWLFAFSLYLQRVQGHSPIQTGIRLVAVFVPLAVVAPLAGRLAGKLGPRLFAGGGLILTGIAFAGLGGVDPHTSYGAMWPQLVLAGVGLAAATPALVAAATASVPSDRAGMAAGVNNTARQAGGAIGVALIGGLTNIHAAVLTAGGVLAAGGLIALASIGGD